MGLSRWQLQMKRLHVTGTAVLCASCAQRPIILPVEVAYLSIDNVQGGGLYDIRFTSTADVLHFFKQQTGEAQNGESLVCSLDGGTNFFTWNEPQKYARDEIAEVDRAQPNALRTYSASVFVRQTKDGSLNTSIPTNELLALLRSRESIPCRVLILGDSYGPYYSGVMSIPAADFLAVVKRKRW